MRTPVYHRTEAAKPLRVVVMMPKAELAAIDGWGGPAGMPSRTATIRMLIQRGLETVTRLETGGQPAAGQGSQA
jgi:hypothetical protein